MALEQIGGLWIKDGKKGKFLSGKIKMWGSEISVMIFRNDKGDNLQRPDYRVMMQVSDEEPPESNHSQFENSEDDDNSIPF